MNRTENLAILKEATRINDILGTDDIDGVIGYLVSDEAEVIRARAKRALALQEHLRNLK